MVRDDKGYHCAYGVKSIVTREPVTAGTAFHIASCSKAFVSAAVASLVADGLVSGFVNGVAAIGGIAVAVLLSTAQMAPVAMRATMIVLFLFTDLYALAWAGMVSAGRDTGVELLGAEALRWALWLAPAMLLGIWVGQRSFAGVSPAQFRRQVLNLLIVIATASVVRAVIALAT